MPGRGRSPAHGHVGAQRASHELRSFLVA